MEPRVFVALPTWGVGEWSPRQWRKSAQDSMFHLDRVGENDDKSLVSGLMLLIPKNLKLA